MDTIRSPIQQKIRVLVVDDSAFVRRALIRMFKESPLIQVIDVAADGEMAIALIKKLRPDVVTMDIRMPVLDGLKALERIMRECPTPVVMLSSLTEKGGENTLKALELGAVDFIDKSSAGGPMDISVIADELAAKIHIAAQIDVHKLLSSQDTREHAGISPPKPILNRGDTEVVLIGTSTGGPPALQVILSAIPAGFPCPILIVQHMPPGFTASLAERLNRTSPLHVKEATDGELIEAGRAYIAPAGKQMKIKRSGGGLQVWLDIFPENALHSPSVDVLFESAALECRGRCLALVLTGMGRDGSNGAQVLKRAGARIVAESEETARVFGMPKAVIESVQVDSIVPLSDVAQTIVKMI
ncbi:MAG TPA: chemotaxis response regulator protein-glutamate methylesterase [Geobacteraceae bacterium]